ncbi:MAG: hypothetical protein OJF62_000459 [Pseudolabrys sp.]|jgi:hypothetical protein|nr:hypothetical protein [Pseudolabrys sp.]
MPKPKLSLAASIAAIRHGGRYDVQKVRRQAARAVILPTPITPEERQCIDP